MPTEAVLQLDGVRVSELARTLASYSFEVVDSFRENGVTTGTRYQSREDGHYPIRGVEADGSSATGASLLEFLE